MATGLSSVPPSFPHPTGHLHAPNHHPLNCAHADRALHRRSRRRTPLPMPWPLTEQTRGLLIHRMAKPLLRPTELHAVEPEQRCMDVRVLWEMAGVEGVEDRE
jgi:hypothetical protein